MRILLPILIYVAFGLLNARMYRKAVQDKPQAEHQDYCNLSASYRSSRRLGCDCHPTMRVGSRTRDVTLHGLFWPGFTIIKTVGALLAFIVYYDRPTLAEKNAKLEAKVDAELKALGD